MGLFFRILGVGVLAAALLEAQAGEATFGAEFTFTNPALLSSPYAQDYQKYPENLTARNEMASILMQRCADSGGCHVEAIQREDGMVDAYRVIYSDGWWFQIATDPSVVEVQTMPTTAERFAQLRARLESDIFGVAAQAGLKPHATTGGGHIHIGAASAFDGDVRLFRDFIVDLVNNAELTNGIFGGNEDNSPTIDALTPEQQRAFEKLVAETDAGRVPDIPTFAKRLQTEVYYATPGGKPPAEKYQALNVVRLVSELFAEDQRTLELRAINPQASFEDFLLQTRLFQARLDHLKASDQRVPLKIPKVLQRGHNRTDRFLRYVAESGLDWEPYARWLPGSERPYADRMWKKFLRENPSHVPRGLPPVLPSAPATCTEILGQLL